MAIGMLALLSGMWAGLLRLGWGVPMPRETFALVHGPLMVSGFVGTLIGVERAVALQRRWAFSGPVLTAFGTVALLVGLPHSAAPLLMTAGSLGLVIVFAIIVREQGALFTITMGLGAVAWLIGNGIWLGGGPIYNVVSWWLGFLVLTIGGERLELSRLLQRRRTSQLAFMAIIGTLLAGLAFGGVASDIGARLTGVGLLGLSLWLARNDVARRTVRQSGLPRFTAICLLSGYVWLAVGGTLAIAYGSVIAGAPYDAVLHAIFLGFVFAMIFGHAPIILPAVLGLPVPFRSVFYAPLIVLHTSLALRLAGDLLAIQLARQYGGLLNGLAVLIFLVNTVRAVRDGRRLHTRGSAVPARAQRLDRRHASRRADGWRTAHTATGSCAAAAAERRRARYRSAHWRHRPSSSPQSGKSATICSTTSGARRSGSGV